VRLHPHPIPLRPFSCPCGFDPRTTLRSLFQTAAALGVSPLQSFLPSANHDGFVTRRSPPDVSPAFGAGPIFRGLRRPMIRFQLRSISSWLVRCSLGFSVRFHGSLMCLQWVTPGGAPNPLMPFCSQVTLLLRLQRLSTHTTGVPFPKEGADRPSVFCPSESGEPGSGSGRDTSARRGLPHVLSPERDPGRIYFCPPKLRSWTKTFHPETFHL
jgi:hypothetical protein